MFGLLSGLLGGAVAPLVERLSTAGAALFRKVALFLVAGLCLLVVLVALTLAFGLWIGSHAGAVAGCLAVAGVYLLVGVIAVAVALGAGGKAAAIPAASGPSRDEERAFNAKIDQFTAPLLRMLQRFGLKRELIAVLAGTSMAKRLGPLPLVGLAIVAGFLVGRMWRSWRTLFTSDAVNALVGALGSFGAKAAAESSPQEDGTA